MCILRSFLSFGKEISFPNQHKLSNVRQSDDHFLSEVDIHVLHPIFIFHSVHQKSCFCCRRESHGAHWKGQVLQSPQGLGLFGLQWGRHISAQKNSWRVSAPPRETKCSSRLARQRKVLWQKMSRLSLRRFPTMVQSKATIPTRDLVSFLPRHSPTKMSLCFGRSFLVDLDQREAPANSASPWMQKGLLQRKWCFWVQLVHWFGRWNGWWATVTLAALAADAGIWKRAAVVHELLMPSADRNLARRECALGWNPGWSRHGWNKTCMTLCCIFQYIEMPRCHEMVMVIIENSKSSIPLCFPFDLPQRRFFHHSCGILKTQLQNMRQPRWVRETIFLFTVLAQLVGLWRAELFWFMMFHLHSTCISVSLQHCTSYSNEMFWRGMTWLQYDSVLCFTQPVFLHLAWVQCPRSIADQDCQEWYRRTGRTHQQGWQQGWGAMTTANVCVCGWERHDAYWSLYKSETVDSQFVILVFHQGGIEFFLLLLLLLLLLLRCTCMTEKVHTQDSRYAIYIYTQFLPYNLSRHWLLRRGTSQWRAKMLRRQPPAFRRPSRAQQMKLTSRLTAKRWKKDWPREGKWLYWYHNVADS